MGREGIISLDNILSPSLSVYIQREKLVGTACENNGIQVILEDT